MTNTSAPSILTEKFRPKTIDSFLGLDKPKRICAKLVSNPFDSSFIFVGEPGLGKTTLVLTVADQMPAELHHIPSQDCTIDRLRAVVQSCQYVPSAGKKMHLVLIDEGDQMSAAAQLYLLSKTDSTGRPPQTIFIVTCNQTERFEARFLSRFFRVEFSSYGNSKDAAELLASVWASEAPADAELPNFARIVKDATGNIREALMALQAMLLLA